MGFLPAKVLTDLEGRYVKFAEGVERTFVLKAHKQEQAKGEWGDYTRHNIIVTDEDGKEKEFSASKRFLQAMARVNDKLDVGKTIKVLPKAASFVAKDGTKVDTLDFDLTVLDEVSEGKAPF